MKRKLETIVIMILLVVSLTGCGGKNDKFFDKTKTLTFDELELNLPVSFEKYEEGSKEDLVGYSYLSEDGKDLCILTLSKINGVSSDLNETISLGLLFAPEINYYTKEINGNNWTMGYVVEDGKPTNYYYAINYNDKQYGVSYNDYGSSNLCRQYLDMIEVSLKLK